MDTDTTAPRQPLLTGQGPIATSAAPPTDDPAHVRRAVTILAAPGAVVELRALKVASAGTVIGFYSDFAKLASDAMRVASRAGGVYVTLNEVNPALLSRAANRLIERADGIGSKDHEITSRRWLPIDFDPVRPAGVLSSDEEHAQALDRAREVRAWLETRGACSPILASSGNGAHLLYRVDLPAEDAGLVTRCLEAISSRFSDNVINIDTSVGNAARIWRLYGVVNRKGDAIVGRPRRMAQLLEVPVELEPVS